MQEKIINVPNTITLIRLILIPFFILSIYQGRIINALIILIIITLGDYIDGLLARHLKQQTNFGQMFDSTVDYLLLISSLSTITHLFIPIPTIIIISVPTVICFVCKVVYVEKTKDLSPTYIGKLTTFFSYTTGIVYLINFTLKEDLLYVSILFGYLTMFYNIHRVGKLIISPERQ